MQSLRPRAVGYYGGSHIPHGPVRLYKLWTFIKIAGRMFYAHGKDYFSMEGIFLSVASQHVTPDNLPQIIDETINDLKWKDVTASAFTGFQVLRVAEEAQGPEGTTIFYGNYPVIGNGVLYALGVQFDDGEYDKRPAGLHYLRAEVNTDGR